MIEVKEAPDLGVQMLRHSIWNLIMTRRGLAILSTSIVVMVVVIASPLSLLLLNSLDLPWERLSAIGQSYTGPAALLSAIALVALVVTVRLQDQQTTVAKQVAVREMQFQLLMLAMNDEGARALFNPTFGSDLEFRKRMFRTMSLRYLQFAFSIGELHQPELSKILQDEIVMHIEDVEWWDRSGRSTWHVASQSTGEREFFAVLDQEIGDIGARLRSAG